MIDARLHALRRLTVAAIGVGVVRCASHDSAPPPPIGANAHPVTLLRPARGPISPVATLGREIFFDPALSGSGRISCATCHDPAHEYGPPNDRAVQPGGMTGGNKGVRAVPGLRYVAFVPPFSIGPANDAAENAGAARAAVQSAGASRVAKRAGAMMGASLVPSGGLFWDGRASTLQSQATGPLFGHAEMDGGNIITVANRLRQRYGERMAQLFGEETVATPARLVDEALFAVARFELEDSSFTPYSSKYDAYLEGKAVLTSVEARGLSVFEDSTKGNCAACHLDRPGPQGEPPAFTDYEYEALGVPRNDSLAVNRDREYADLGLCGPARRDLSAVAAYCGLFRTPSLRNVATRKVFFHNGVYRTLADVVRFYNLRAVDPGAIYGRDRSGRLRGDSDLPASFRGNIDTIDAPFNRRSGERPPMTREEMGDLVAFLGTLTDGYRFSGSSDRR
ncbi:MAG TPA: cytochrome c peroxidase [Gemmatimonadales bacterium]|jgi:cytochrome c peroxidase